MQRKAIKQKSRLGQHKTIINTGLKKSKLSVARRKQFMMDFDSQCSCFRKETVGMEYVSRVGKDSERMNAAFER